MRRFTIFMGLILMIAMLSSVAIAVPTVSAETPVVVGDDENGDPAEKPKEAKKNRPDRSTRDKWAPKTPAAPPKGKDMDKYKPWKEVLKDADKHEGLFDVYTKREDLYFAINEDQLDKPFIAFMSLSKGIGARFVLGGLPISETVMFDFHRVEDHIQMRMMNTLFRSGDDPALKDAVDLSYGNSILFNLKIESEDEKNKALLVDVGEVFLSDISDMSFFLQLVLQKPVRFDNKKSIYRKIKTFPENIEIEALLTYSPGDRRGLNLPQVPDSRFIELGVHYSIHMLPESPMKPRYEDDRVGYFTTPYKDFSRDARENFFVHHINRWRLEKKDPNASVSEPKEPIVYYLDTTIPKKYRPYVAQGIELWQRAFEAAGFKNAIIAKEVGDDENYDAEDARYNTIRWIISDEPSFGAIGPSRVDPRTGEILDADILMEQNMISSFRKTYRRFAGPEAIADIDPMLRYLQDPAEDPERAAEIELQRRFLGHTCDMMTGFMNGFEFGALALLARGDIGDGMEVPEEFIGQAIVFVTAHEVGHTLGLRHNFKSSAATPYEKLNDRKVIEEIGMTGSVMDYPTPNVARDRSKQGYYYTPTVGTYDLWAITYGYKEIPGDRTAKEEYDILASSVANKASDKKNLYGTDEDTYPAGALDPSSMIWDLSDDPLQWAKERMAVCRDVLTDGSLVGRVVTEGDNYVALWNAVETLLYQEYISATRAVKYVGGQYTARPHEGDNAGEMPLMPVDAAKQRDAMNFIIANAFSKEAFTIAPEILNKLQDDKQWTWQNNLFSFGRRFDFPLTGWVAGLQNATLVQLLSPMRMHRMLDAQYKTDNPYTLAEMMRALTDEIWINNPVPSGNTAVMQRNLQRMYLHYLVQFTVTPPSTSPWEAVALARYQLQRIGSGIDQAYKRPGLSDEANAHLAESRARINRALDAKLQASF